MIEIELKHLIVEINNSDTSATNLELKIKSDKSILGYAQELCVGLQCDLQISRASKMHFRLHAVRK